MYWSLQMNMLENTWRWEMNPMRFFIKEISSLKGWKPELFKISALLVYGLSLNFVMRGLNPLVVRFVDNTTVARFFIFNRLDFQ